MKVFLILLGLFAAVSMGCGKEEPLPKEENAPVKKPATFEERWSYLYGFDQGSRAQKMPLDFQVAQFEHGLRDGLQGRKSILSEEERQKTLEEYRLRMTAAPTKRATGPAEENRKAGEAFLAANQKKEGVVVTGSGLQYRILREGNGPKPKLTDKVKVHYRG
ncbi:MAG: FKBP-type peptidyl-prolyl cis-trans isomerase N-terminal domain-containing protein, partial [Planctomycetota bacterium]